MSNTASACRSLTLRALALVCAVMLAGCSILSGEEGGAGPQVSAGQQDQQTAPQGSDQSAGRDQTGALSPTSATGAASSARKPAAPEPSPGWNLHTLESTDMPGARVRALGLEHAWRLAVLHDPEYQAALSGRAAAQTEIRLGRAAILPQVQAGYSRNRISGLQRQYSAGMMREGELDYDSTSAYIQLQQPLFNMDRYATFQRGRERARLGEAEFAMQEYEAAMRLATAYLDAVAALGRSQLAHALADSLEEQARTQDALFEQNEASVVDAQETRARLALAQADVILAEDELRVARRQLQALIGPDAPEPAGVDGIDPERVGLGESLVYWLERAQINGAAIRAADARVRVADTEVRRAVARHLPTVDLVMALADADSENLDSLSQRSNTFTVGVNVAIPLFSGGYDTANHARSRDERRQAEHELTQAREQTAAEITRRYTAVEGGAQRIAALISSVQSGEESLEAARYGYEYGVNSNLDVLRRQDSLFQARDELLTARVVWLEARIALSVAAGEPVAAVFIDLDQVLSR